MPPNSKLAFRLQTFATNLLTVIASVAVVLLACELVLRFLPVASSPAIEPSTAENPIQRYSANTPFTWSLGWDFSVVVHGRTNAQGFVADYDYDPKAGTPLIAVLGNSYVEGLMIPFAQTITGRIQAALGSRGRAYAIAQSGAPLSQYVAYAKHACAVYRPERLAVAIFGGDLDSSLYANRTRDGFHNLHPLPSGGFDLKLSPLTELSLFERVSRHSALALYLIRNVKVLSSIERLRKIAHAEGGETYVGNVPATTDPGRIAEGERVISWFLDALPTAACLRPQHIVIMVDAMRPQIYDEIRLAQVRGSYFAVLRAKLMSEATAKGFKVIDMEFVFRAAHDRDRRTFEFRDDNHWTPHGHAVAADALREALADWPPLAVGQPRLSEKP
jgi:hypothetical protein